MKVKLKNLSVLPSAKMFSALYTILGIIAGSIMAIAGMVTGEDQFTFGLGPWAVVVIPLLNMIMGFILGAFISWAYNLLSKSLGGFELEFEAED